MTRLLPARRLLWPAGGALGVVAEWSLIGSGDVRGWVPDLVAGWLLIGCGLFGWRRWPESRSGVLLAMTGFAWFAPNFAPSDVGAVDWLAAHALFLHRGPLLQLALTYPVGRVRGRLDRAGVALAWGAALVAPAWRSEWAAIVLATAFAGVALINFVRATGVERRLRLVAFEATAFVAIVIAATVAVRLGIPTGHAQESTLLVYDAALCLFGVALVGGLARRPWTRAVTTDLIVELGEGRSGRLRDALAEALDDPMLTIGYWLPERQAYVDADGLAVELPRRDEQRRVTTIEHEGTHVAVLVHDVRVEGVPVFADAVGRAARLTSSNARLYARMRAQVDELDASRRRLVEVAGEERARLELRLRESVAVRLTDLDGRLERASASARQDQAAAYRLARAREQLALAVEELRELAAGLHPSSIADVGLAAALRALADRNPTPVRLEVNAGRVPVEVAVAIYFVCSEAFANVAKYANASSIAVAVNDTGSELEVVVSDDGVGGADLNRGSGLRGLQDRVEALGGTLALRSPLGRGTTLGVRLPRA
jgi:signal transduction histidine kinase